MTASAGVSVLGWEPRRGARHLWRSYVIMIRYEVTSLRLFLGLALVIQTLIGAGMAVMYGFYLGDLSPAAATFLVSGIPALALFPIGFVIVPNAIIGYRVSGTYDYLWSLPVPRLASAAATFTVFTTLAIPGTVLSLLLSVLVYDVQLAPNWSVVPAVFVAAIMSTSVGYALGHGVREPTLANLITNLLVFLVLMFSPIVVPIELFPDWMASVHRVLPFWHMANLVRAGLTEGLVANVAASYAVASAWALVSAVIAGRVITRRK